MGLCVAGAKKTGNLAQRTKRLAQILNLYRDSFDLVQLADKELGTDMFGITCQHQDGLIQSTWGVHFDNPEQAVQEFKVGKPGIAFNSLTKEQQLAIFQQTTIKRNLLKLRKHALIPWLMNRSGDHGKRYKSLIPKRKAN